MVVIAAANHALAYPNPEHCNRPGWPSCFRLPSGARDFRLSLSDEENRIWKAELSDILSSLSRSRHLLEATKSNRSYPRGRPNSNSTSNDERRGRGHYYEESKIKQIIDEVLSDPEYYSKIDSAISNSAVFLEHGAYSIEVGLRQLKQNEGAFLTTVI